MHSRLKITCLLLLCVGLVPPTLGAGEEVYSKHFTWSYGGYVWSWDLSIPANRYNAYKSVPVSTRYQFGPASWDFLVTTNESYVRSMAGTLHEAAIEKGYSSYEEVSFILAFVQCLPYTSDDVTTGYNEYPRFPLETLVDDGGDCEDTAILFATLVIILNYSAIFINPPNHMAVGVWGNASVPGSYYLHDGRRYYYCETTGEGFVIGQIPPDYQSVGVKLYDIDESRQYIPSNTPDQTWWLPYLVIILIIAGFSAAVFEAKKYQRRGRQGAPKFPVTKYLPPQSAEPVKVTTQIDKSSNSITIESPKPLGNNERNFTVLVQEKQCLNQSDRIPDSCAFCLEKVEGGNCGFCGAWFCRLCGRFNNTLDDTCGHCHEPRSRSAEHKNSTVPREIVQTLFLIALKQPLSLALLINRLGKAAFKHVQILEKRDFVRVERKGDDVTLNTTEEFAEIFGLSRDRVKMQTELRSNFDRINQKHL